MADLACLRAAVDAALARPLGGSPARVVPPGSITGVVLDGEALEPCAAVLPALLRALGPGAAWRLLVIVTCESGAVPSRAAAVACLPQEARHATLVVHDPDHNHAFVPGVTSRGVPVELDDVLLDAETLVTVGPVWLGAGGRLHGGGGLIFPGLASRRARAAHLGLAEAAGVRAAAELLTDRDDALRMIEPPDFQLCWIKRAQGEVRAWAGTGLTAERRAVSGLASPSHPG